MADFLENEQTANLFEEMSSQEETLGIRNPLLSPTPLGQQFLSPKFIFPLGARPLSVLDTSNFSLNATPVQGFSNEDSWNNPFLVKTQSNLASAALGSTKAEANCLQPQIKAEHPAGPPTRLQANTPYNLTAASKNESFIQTKTQLATKPAQPSERGLGEFPTKGPSQAVGPTQLDSPLKSKELTVLAKRVQRKLTPSKLTKAATQAESLIQTNAAPRASHITPQLPLSLVQREATSADSTESTDSATPELARSLVVQRIGDEDTSLVQPSVTLTAELSPVPLSEASAPDSSFSASIQTIPPATPDNLPVQRSVAPVEATPITPLVSKSPESSTHVPAKELPSGNEDTTPVQRSAISGKANLARSSAELSHELSPLTSASEISPGHQATALVQPLVSPLAEVTAATPSKPFVTELNAPSTNQETTSITTTTGSSTVQRLEAPSLTPIAASDASVPQASAIASTTSGEDTSRLQRSVIPTAEVSPAPLSEASALESSLSASTPTIPSARPDNLPVQRSVAPVEVSPITPLVPPSRESSTHVPAKELPSGNEDTALVQRAATSVEANLASPSAELSHELSPLTSASEIPRGQGTALVQLSGTPAEVTAANPSQPSATKFSAPRSTRPSASIPTDSTLVQRLEAPSDPSSPTASDASISRSGAIASTTSGEDTSPLQRSTAPAVEVTAVTPPKSSATELSAIAPTTTGTEGSSQVQRSESLVKVTTATPFESSATAIDFPIQRETINAKSVGLVTPESNQDIPDATEITHSDQSLTVARRETLPQTKTQSSVAINTLPPALTSKPTLEGIAPTTAEASLTAASISEFAAPASQTVAQLLSEREIPQLPRVLKNLATIKPLGISAPLVQRSEIFLGTSLVESLVEPTTNREVLTSRLYSDSDREHFAANTHGESPQQGRAIQRQASSISTEEVPESWSSIEELLGESNSSENEPTVVQTFNERGQSATENLQSSQNQSDIRTSMLLPPGISKGVKGVKSLGLLEQPAVLHTLMQESLKSSAKLKEAVSTRKGEKVEPIQVQDLEGLGVKISPQVVKPEKEENGNSDHVENLAREIYSLLRQRLEIERERHGFYHSSRIPW